MFSYIGFFGGLITHLCHQLLPWPRHCLIQATSVVFAKIRSFCFCVILQITSFWLHRRLLAGQARAQLLKGRSSDKLTVHSDFGSCCWSWDRRLQNGSLSYIVNFLRFLSYNHQLSVYSMPESKCVRLNNSMLISTRILTPSHTEQNFVLLKIYFYRPRYRSCASLRILRRETHSAIKRWWGNGVPLCLMAL